MLNQENPRSNYSVAKPNNRVLTYFISTEDHYVKHGCFRV